MRFNRIGTCFGIAGVFMILRLAISMAQTGQNDLRPAILLSGVAFLSIAILMLVQLGFTVSLARIRMSAGRSALVALGGLCIFIGVMYLLMKVKLSEPVIVAFLLALRDLSLMTFAASLGYTISFIVRDKNILLPAAMFAAVVDYWGVTWGPLSVMLVKQPAVVAAASVQMPTPVAHVPGTMIGMGDFLFLALFFGVLYRYDLNVKSAFWIGYALLTATMFLVMAVDIAVPALVPMSIAIVAANIKKLQLKREEKLATIYVGAFLLVLIFSYKIFFMK
ncbi:MAG: hypothetical protein ACYC27_00505 [Armatimonadota bacterium]